MLHACLFCLFTVQATLILAADDAKPNILWLTSEDHGPHVGCYGDELATTPNMDALAKKGMLYKVCWSNNPVCAAARTTLIAGIYSPSTGGQHMRSMARLPDEIKMYPQFLREAGYYCTNRSKEDYNLKKPRDVWDESSGKAHWRNRAKGQPFFAIFNSTKSHESQIRTRPHRWAHDPAQVRVPAYHPDTKEVREDWAQYYDAVTSADADAGKVLSELEQDGLVDDTIVFFYADHGSGMPRSKRFPYDSGLRVPLVVYFPEKFKHLAPPEYKPGGSSDRLVSFVDLAPTLLSLIGQQAPAWMQGHAFAGKYDAGPQPYVYGFRDRMDERYDLIRTVRDQRYVYVRNYMPHLPCGQHIEYMFETPTTRVWKTLHDAGKLTAEQDLFWNKRLSEELYDLQNDPAEVHNLAASPEHRETLERMRKAQEAMVMRIRDLGFLPESEMHARAGNDAPYTMGHDDRRYPLARIHAAAALASGLKADATPELIKLLADDDCAVRYWAAMGLLMRERAGVAAGAAELRRALNDPVPCVQIAAAQALTQFGDDADFRPSLDVLIHLASPQETNAIVAIAALNAIDALGDRAAVAADAIRKLPAKGNSPDGRFDGYAGRLLKNIQFNLKP